MCGQVVMWRVRSSQTAAQHTVQSPEWRGEKYTRYRVGSCTSESATMEPTSGGGLVCGLAENEGAGVRSRASARYWWTGLMRRSGERRLPPVARQYARDGRAIQCCVR